MNINDIHSFYFPSSSIHVPSRWLPMHVTLIELLIVNVFDIVNKNRNYTIILIRFLKQFMRSHSD